uniref:Pyruvate dehydrogenase phosphatase regulatory subunit, mitochondrial n=1 Tax=Scolopendra viridis TaxID=118503 RepID=A0A4D5RB29_SCOVI
MNFKLIGGNLIQQLHFNRFISSTLILNDGLQAISSAHATKNNALPAHARVVICGAGVVGTSLSYHLVQKGWTDIIVLDQGSVGGGTSWQGPGLVGQFRSSHERAIVTESALLYKSLQEDGHEIGWHQCGSLNIAQTKDRWISLKRFFNQVRADGIECQLLTPSEILTVHPFLKVDDLQGGVYLSGDGIVDSHLLCITLANLAKEGGARFVENCKVQKILTSSGKVASVNTNLGIIKCDYFVSCSGLWSHELGLNSQPVVRVPVHAALHTYLTTKPLAGGLLSPTLPFVQDYDGRVYAREHNEGLLAGGFEIEGKPVFHTRSPEKLEFQLLPDDWNRFKPLYENLLLRFPVLKELEIQHLYVTPENFTPDGKWIIGESTEVKNYYIGCGMNGNSALGAGGLGKVLANWVIYGESSSHLHAFDIKRFMEFHNNKKFLRERVKEIAGRHYALLYPLQSEFRLARKLRCSPLYTVQESAGAVFGERMGFERALYFDSYQKVESGNSAIMNPPKFGKPDWFEFVKDEYLTCRKGVGVLDLSSLTKTEIWSAGSEVVDFLQYLCSNDVNIPVGSIIQTGMQNERGGFENDCVIIRRAENYYLIISPTIQHTRVKDWISRHIPLDGSVSFSDVTSMYTVLNVVGPKSKELMTELTNTDMTIHPFTYKEVNVGYASGIMVMGFTNTGEPGYSLYMPSEYALHIYDRLMATGVDYGLRNVGYFALRYLRIEKFIPFMAEEMDNNTTPYEVNRGYKVKLEKDYFLGKSALMKQHEKGLTRRLVHFTVDNHDLENDVWPWGKESILRNGVNVGMTTSAGYGFTLNSLVCMGFVHHHEHQAGEPMIVTNEYITDKGAQFEIVIAGKKFPLRPSLHPPIIPVSLDAMNQRYIPKARQNILSAKN